MALDDHRNPGGTYDGIGAMAEFTRLPRSEVEAIAAQVKANHAKLAGCPWHEFERIPRPDDAVLQARLGDRFRCRHCHGEVDAPAYHWHQQGRRPMPVGEPQPVAYSFTPVPGATCSRELAAAGKPYPRTCQVHGLRCGVEP